jgi:(p)ppGpp synthase/HD superfamily hydrolase
MGDVDIADNSFLLDSALRKLLDTTDSYLDENEKAFIFHCYSLASNSIAIAQDEVVQKFFLQALHTSFDLAELKFGSEFIASTLLYYPISANILNLDQIKLAGENVHFLIKKLLGTEKFFENFLPWEQNQIKEKKNDGLFQSSKKDMWKERTIENSAQVLIQVSQIPEVAAIKVIDRLHLLKESEKLFDSQTFNNIAQQTLDIHAIVAERLGIWSIKWKLDDAAFKILQPNDYQSIKRELNERREERELAIQTAIEILKAAFRKEGLSNIEITGRPKHIYGLYLKSKASGQPIETINDNLGLRVITNTKEECYQAVDILYRTWERVEGIYGNKPYRDWIAAPKSNHYQSIHATVYLAQIQNKLLEIQIRTREMHNIAEYGIASHWIYRKAGNSSKKQNKYQKQIEEMAEFRRVLESRPKNS